MDANHHLPAPTLRLPDREALRRSPMAAAPSFTPPHCWASAELLAGSREVHIDHDGSLYRLRVTALGKLILTK